MAADPIIKKVMRITVIVRDQEEALQWYTGKLGFEKRADLGGPGFRWLTVAPREQKELEVVLALPGWSLQSGEQAREWAKRIGQAPTCVLETGDCRKTFAELAKRGVKFSSEPREQPYGVEAVFEDLYGNMYSLLQPTGAGRS